MANPLKDRRLYWLRDISLHFLINSLFTPLIHPLSSLNYYFLSSSFLWTYSYGLSVIMNERRYTSKKCAPGEPDICFLDQEINSLKLQPNELNGWARQELGLLLERAQGIEKSKVNSILNKYSCGPGMRFH